MNLKETLTLSTGDRAIFPSESFSYFVCLGSGKEADLSIIGLDKQKNQTQVCSIENKVCHGLNYESYKNISIDFSKVSQNTEELYINASILNDEKTL
jgi:hypothetical protein